MREISLKGGIKILADFEFDEWMSLEDYLALDHENLDQKYEYIDGHLYALAGGSNNHSYIAGNMFSILRERLRGSPCKPATSDMMFLHPKGKCLFPDVSVSCHPKDTQEIKNSIQFPTLVVEVLSPSTEMRDRVRKFRFYQQCPTIKEYVLINQYRKEVEIYSRLDTEWKYRMYTSGDEIELKSLNITFHIDLLYEDAILPEEAE